MNSAPSDFGVVSSSVQKKEGGGGGEEEDMSQFSLGNKWLHARDRSHPGRDLAWNQQFAPSAQKTRPVSTQDSREFGMDGGMAALPQFLSR